MTVKGPSDSEAHKQAVISGILIRNSLRSPRHMFLCVFNNGKSSCFEVGLDFGNNHKRHLEPSLVEEQAGKCASG